MKRPNLRTWWASPSSAQQCPATPSNAQPAQVPKLRLVCNLGDIGDDPFSLKEASLHPDLPFGRTSAQSFCNCLPEFSSQHTDDLCQLLISVCGWLPWEIILAHVASLGHLTARTRSSGMLWIYVRQILFHFHDTFENDWNVSLFLNAAREWGLMPGLVLFTVFHVCSPLQTCVIDRVYSRSIDAILFVARTSASRERRAYLGRRFSYIIFIYILVYELSTTSERLIALT
jgi:hypothetical protein